MTIIILVFLRYMFGNVLLSVLLQEIICGREEGAVFVLPRVCIPQHYRNGIQVTIWLARIVIVILHPFIFLSFLSLVQYKFELYSM